jgi:competence protein ComEC
MQGYAGALWCIAWIVGLLTTRSPLWTAALATIAFPCIGFTLRKLRPAKFQTYPWMIASAIVLIAVGWFNFRTPQPSEFDISRYVNAIDRTSIHVNGIVETLPRTTRSGKTQLWLNVQSLDAGDLNSRLTLAPDKANGKLYVTIGDRRPSFPPGTQVRLSGKLYAPKPAQNPGGFDFKKYLATEGCFAGLTVDDFKIVKPVTGWGLWQLQQRIVQAQMAGLPGEEGLLLSAMVLGNRAVDLPSAMQDAFTKIGMSHALAASGFQVSLTLSVVLALCARSSKQVKAISGSVAIVILIGLAGAQPAILRAGVMGFAVLGAIVVDKKIKPIGSLLFASSLLLVWNPLWIWNLGFQLSALATLGLLVTSEPVQKRLDWMPSPIAAAFATPIAAYLWTLPLQLYSFGLVSPYSIPANVVTTVLISIISLGGMVSALCAAIVPAMGSFTAGLLHLPIATLLAIVEQMGKLPGSQWAVGSISLAVLILLYGLLTIASTLHLFWPQREEQQDLIQNSQPKSQRYWIMGMTIAALSLVFVPAWQQAQSRIQITALTTSKQPVLVMQARGKALLVNTGDRSSSDNTILPFLQKQGINHIDALIQLHPTNDEGIQALRDRLPIRQILKSTDLPDFKLGPIAIRSIPLSVTQTALKIELPKQKTWILATQLPKGLSENTFPTENSILWWNGGYLPEGLSLQAAIVYGKTLRPATAQTLDQQKVLTFHLVRDGAVQWTPKEGFSTTLSPGETEFASL